MTKQRTPFEVDTELAELYREYDKARDGRMRIADYLRSVLVPRAARSTMSFAQILDAARAAIANDLDGVRSVLGRDGIASRLAKIEQLGVTKVEIGVKIAECDREYDEQGGWSRFFLATSHNGHVHSSMSCSTCNRGGQSTSFAWRPELSGKTEAEAVEEWGEKMCTVCFPLAPTNPNYHRPSRLDREAAQAKAAEKAAKAADKAAKGITNPDGTELVVGRKGLTERPKTLIAAQRLLLARLGDVHFYRGLGGRAHHEEPQWLADADVLVAAIAAKTGQDATEIRRTAEAKAAKKAAQDLKG